MGVRRIMAILDHQVDFVVRLARYMERKDNFPYDVVTFTKSEELINYELSNTVNLLLCEDTIAYSTASDFKAQNICLLTEYTFVNETVKYPTIFKYQSAEEIINEVLKIADELQIEPEISTEKTTSVIGVCSPSGGSCKSTFALAMALKHAERENTLFLSFDPFFNIPGTEKEDRGQNLSDIIYFLKQSHDSIHLKVKAVTRRKGNLDYILGVAHWIDLLELTPNDIQGLIDGIVSKLSYDAIIIDAGNFGITSMELLTHCDTVYVPNLCDGSLEKEKEREWKRQLKFIGSEKLLAKIQEVDVPIDENLSSDNYSVETIEHGVVGNLIEELFFRNEYAYG